jgi:hypothetical protein
MKQQPSNKNRALRGCFLEMVIMGGDEKTRFDHLHGLQRRNGLRWNQCA